MSDKKPHTFRKIAVGSAVAGAVGYLAGVLSAPRSGKETRQAISAKAEQVKDSAEEQLQDVNDQLRQTIKDTKTKTISMGASARSEFNEALMRAKDAQNKSSQVLKAFRNGEAEDPDLNKAIKQGRQALKNLARYMRN